MASYTDDELLEAVRTQMTRDRKFRLELEDAINSKWTVRLRKLIADIAEIFFGRTIGSIVDKVLSWFLN